ncbi:MAG TPA: TIGR02996 domain-containing protein [Urbifossiella sp.]|nr:TIGR02996 domain-containing protein [Urbifossiella sp.]
MTDEAALRAAVLAHPDDDTPRLVYADWCDDAGDADRAAFIRAQVEAARAMPWSPAQRDAEARAAPYLGPAVYEWRQAVGVPFHVPEFVRGFVEGVELFADDVGDRLRGLREANPIRRVRLRMESVADAWSLSKSVTDVFPAPELAGITALDASHADLYSTLDYEALAASEPLAGLTELTLARRLVPPDWLSRFLAGEELPALAALDLADIPNLGPALADGLGARRHRAFTKLNFTGVSFRSRVLKRVLESPALAAVEELRLGWSYPGEGPATLINLAWLMPWRRLRLLDLAGQHIGPDGVREITDEPRGAGLRWLGLSGNELGDNGARRLVESRHLHLYHLDVTGNDIAPPLLAALRARFPEAVVVG